jgi:hypothetical protein
MSSSKPTGKKASAGRRPPAGKRPAKAAAKPAAKRAKPARKVATAAGASEPVSAQMLATAAAMEKALAASDLTGVPNESLQKLIAAVVKIYAAKVEAGETFLPVSSAGRVTPTDIMVTSSKLLRSGNLQVFELGMWQSWTGN